MLLGLSLESPQGFLCLFVSHCLLLHPDCVRASQPVSRAMRDQDLMRKRPRKAFFDLIERLVRVLLCLFQVIDVRRDQLFDELRLGRSYLLFELFTAKFGQLFDC